MSVDRVPALMEALDAELATAEALIARGRAAFDADIAISLALEAVSNHVGELAKRLVAADPARFHEEMWALAAQHRDFVVHHYLRLDRDRLWITAVSDFPRLRDLVRQK